MNKINNFSDNANNSGGTISPRYGSTLHAKVLYREEWHNMSRQNEQVINTLKKKPGWINNYTPPPGYSLNPQGFSIQNSVINATNTNNTLPLQPPSSDIQIPHPDTVSQISVNFGQAGGSFGRTPVRSVVAISNAERQQHSTTISPVSIAGRPYTGAIYNAHGRRLNGLICRFRLLSWFAVGWLHVYANWICSTIINRTATLLSCTAPINSLIFFAIISSIINKTTGKYPRHHHNKLSQDELKEGCQLEIDTWADTVCADKHAYVESYVEGKLVNATCFSSSLESINNLTIVTAVYAYDYLNGDTILLVVNNAIDIGSLIDDLLLNPIQCLENGVRIDIRPSKYYQEKDNTCQSIQIPKLEMAIPI